VCNRSAVKEPESHSGQDQPGLWVVYGAAGAARLLILEKVNLLHNTLRAKSPIPDQLLPLA